MNTINNNTFNLHNSFFLNNDNRYMKDTLMSKLFGVARLLRILNLHMAYKAQGNFKRYL